jgi:predicted outer membrane protein
MRYHCQITLFAVALLLALGGISHFLLVTSSGAATTTQADDRTIMAAFIQDNQFDVDMATIAVKRSAGKDVKDLAEMIVHDHTQIGHRAEALQATLGWKQASQGSAAVRPAREKVLAELQVSTPHDFDDLYLQHERDFSKGFVHAMKTQWLPTVQHPQFKAFLTDVTKQLDEHMAHMSHIGGTPDPHNPHGH